jgi:CheY-like chemotaxis protein
VREIAQRCCDQGIPCLFLLPAHATAETDCGDRSAELRKPALPADIIEAAESLILGPRRPAANSASPRQSSSRRANPPASESAKPRTHRKNPQLALHEPDASNDAHPVANVRILVAEDGEINQEVIVGILEMRGYQVVVANDGEEAVSKAASDSFELCLMDVDMPRMDGLEATRTIRQKHSYSGNAAMPIIAMTAHSGDQIWEKCQAAGMNAYLAKPIEPDALFATIERYTARSNDPQAEPADSQVSECSG